MNANKKWLYGIVPSRDFSPQSRRIYLPYHQSAINHGVRVDENMWKSLNPLLNSYIEAESDATPLLAIMEFYPS
jgi:hypothetical protein